METFKRDLFQVLLLRGEELTRRRGPACNLTALEARSLVIILLLSATSSGTHPLLPNPKEYP